MFYTTIFQLFKIIYYHMSWMKISHKIQYLTIKLLYYAIYIILYIYCNIFLKAKSFTITTIMQYILQTVLLNKSFLGFSDIAVNRKKIQCMINIT